MYSKFTPTCFGKWLPSSGGRRCLRAIQVTSVLWVYTDYDPSSVASRLGTCWGKPGHTLINPTSFMTHLLVIYNDTTKCSAQPSRSRETKQ
jgi:hypothetical protein